jgi:hypothetical protein
MVISALLWGCGPADYLNTTVLKATRRVAEAKAAGAERWAPYEFWTALEYLHMSKEKAAYADYLASWHYGRKAMRMGTLARKLAAEKGQAAPSVTISPPSQIPVKIESAPKPAPASQSASSGGTSFSESKNGYRAR